MGRYLERVFEVIRSEADRPLFVDGDQSITYGEVEQESGKIYRYLRSKGIGKEDFVQIIVKKDIHFYSCMLGVWRAGAAFVINDASYPKERLEFIGKDLQAKIVLDKPLFEKIMAEQEPLSGYEETDPHDACYAVYTSGSTGNPKGVLHEYGNLDQSMESFFPMAQEYLHYRNGFVPPLNFVASILESVVSTACAMTNFMVSGEMLRDYNALTKFIAEEKLDRIYLPPSYIRIYKKPAECLKVVQTGSEPANGLYYEGGIPEIVNTYSMSEAGFCVLRTILDRAYDVAPVGFSGLAGIEYELIDDDGKVVEGAGQGELCFANEYVRGYINLPEQTAKAFVDGMYHTGDICRRDEKGAYYVVGRNDDMIKINGNRIEPAEIEAAVQRCGGLEKVIAKGFSDKKRSFIAVYYLEDEAEKNGFDQEKTAEEIKKIIPSYMLPTYYVPMKSFPMNANGKLSKKDLPKPDDDSKESAYAEPANDKERYFCEKMKEVLGVDRIGAEDDFYLSGGDSISAIKLVEACTEYEVSVHQIYEYKTPRNLAKHCGKAKAQGEEEESLVIEGDLPLLPTQVQFLYYQTYAPDSAFLTMARFQKLKEDVDTERLKGAVKKLLFYHPELCVKIRDEGEGKFVLAFEKAFLDEEPVEEIKTEETDPKRIKDLVNAPFSVFGKRLFRTVIIKNKDARYFWFAIHHVLTDGGSFVMLLNDLYELYNDETFVPVKDRWFQIVQRQNEARKQKGFAEAGDYFKKRLSSIASGRSIGLKKDFDSKKRRSEIVREMGCFERKQGYDTNFFLTAVAVATARYNGEDGAFVYSTFNGRYDRDTINCAGFLITQLVTGLEVEENAKPSKLLSSMNEQIQFSINHLGYNYMNENIGDASEMVRFIYQKDTIDAETKLDRLSLETYEGNTLDRMSGVFSINIIDDSREDRLGLIVRYCPDVYKKESIDRFIETLKDAVVFLEDSGKSFIG